MLPWVEPELFFCLDEELIPDLLSDLDASDLGSDLFLEDLEVWVPQENSPCHSQYCAEECWVSLGSSHASGSVPKRLGVKS